MVGYCISGMLSMDRGICVYVLAVLSFRFFWNNWAAKILWMWHCLVKGSL